MPPTTSSSAIGLEAQVHDWVGGRISLLYEEDDTPLEVDEAYINIAPPSGPWHIKGGQYYVPFGVFDSGMISDPLTLEIGETRETAVEVGFNAKGFSGAVYVFNGTNKQDGDNIIDNFGAALGYEKEGKGAGFAVNVGYIR